MTESFSSMPGGKVTHTAVTAEDGVVSFYQLIRGSLFDPESGAPRPSYDCIIITVACGEIDTALLTDVSSRQDTALALFTALSKGSVTPSTVYDVIEDMVM